MDGQALKVIEESFCRTAATMATANNYMIGEADCLSHSRLRLLLEVLSRSIKDFSQVFETSSAFSALVVCKKISQCYHTTRFSLPAQP